MSAQANAEVTAADVERYLSEHPDFFHEHLQLLEKMHIPHPSGNAVSLITKQLEIYRSKHHELENQLSELIDIARDNDTSYERMHKLTLAMLDSKTIEDAVNNIKCVLAEDFLIDFVAIRILKKNAASGSDTIFIDPDSEELLAFRRELSSHQPTCGKPTLIQAKLLFGDAALDVTSYAVIPMLYTEIEGFLAVGSKEENRFHYSMGSLFLKQMSEIIGTRMIALLEGE
jgi:uncharacterized protein YigA (DUF484 family)